MKTLSYILKVIGLGIAVTALSIPAYAKDTIVNGKPGTRSITISYGDLDLSRPAGIDTLYDRLRIAGERVCAPRAQGGPLAVKQDWKQCFARAVDEAVSHIDNPQLSLAHTERTGRSVGSDQRIASSN